MDLAREKEIKEILCSCTSTNSGMAYFEDLKKIGIKLREDKQITQLMKFFKALGNKDRLMIVEILNEKGELCVCELEAILDKSQPSISHHLRTLERIEVIRGWKKGKFTYYALMCDKFNEYVELFKKEFNLKELYL